LIEVFPLKARPDRNGMEICVGCEADAPAFHIMDSGECCHDEAFSVLSYKTMKTTSAFNHFQTIVKDQ